MLMNPHQLLPTSASVTTSAQWYAYYKANAEFQLDIPWKLGAEITEDERNTIAASLAAWQLGETSDGSHLLAAAKNYAKRIKDPKYVDVIKLFIKEEQRHGNDLGKFLDLAHIPRLKRNWGDTIFRLVRYSTPNMEIWTTPVIIVETLALVYYKAMQKATNSIVLRQLCQQILRDEVKHIRFQYERLAIIYKNRPIWLRQLTHIIQRMLFLVAVILVWIGHHHALKAGGHNFRSYWQDAWVKMNFAWQRMKPEKYQ
jgi:hypothetical protein